MTTYTINSLAFSEGTQTWGFIPTGILTAATYNSIADADNESGTRVSKILRGTAGLMKTCPLKEDTVRNLGYTIEEDDTNELYSSTITEYVTEQRTLFIIGTKDINSDADWKSYLAQFDELHLDDIVKIKQDAYDRSQK